MTQRLLRRDDLATYFSRLDSTNLEHPASPLPPPKTIILDFDTNSPLTGTLPRRMIVPDEEIDELFAWVGTYLDVLSPITSFIEVVTSSESTYPGTARISPNLRSALLAVAAIEGAVQMLRSRTRIRPGFLAAALRTISWVYAQLIMRGASDQMAATLLERWVRVRSELTGVDLPLPLQHVTAFWNAVLPAMNMPVNAPVDDLLMRVNRRMLERGELAIDEWNALLPTGTRVTALEPGLRGPRQGRIELLDQALSELSNEGPEAEGNAAFCGYLASRVADSSLDLWQVVADRAGRFPTLPLWYAFYCGANASGKALDFQRSVQRRLLRTFDDDFYDVDARELLVMARKNVALVQEAQVPNPGNLRARLGPGIIASFLAREVVAAQPSEPQRTRSDLPQATMFDARAAQALLAETRNASERVMINLSRIQSMFSPQPRPAEKSNGPQQADLGLLGRGESVGRKAKPKRGKS